MSLNVAWKSLSVAEFIDNCHWLGWQPEVITEVNELSRSLKELKQSLLGWQTLTTQDFFALNNWNGLSILPINVSETTAVYEKQTFSFTLKNKLFWTCFAWDGPAITAQKTKPIAEPAPEYTLDNLSQLF